MVEKTYNTREAILFKSSLIIVRADQLPEPNVIRYFLNNFASYASVILIMLLINYEDLTSPTFKSLKRLGKKLSKKQEYFEKHGINELYKLLAIDYLFHIQQDKTIYKYFQEFNLCNKTFQQNFLKFLDFQNEDLSYMEHLKEFFNEKREEYYLMFYYQFLEAGFKSSPLREVTQSLFRSRATKKLMDGMKGLITHIVSNQVFFKTKIIEELDEKINKFTLKSIMKSTQNLSLAHFTLGIPPTNNDFMQNFKLKINDYLLYKYFPK